MEYIIDDLKIITEPCEEGWDWTIKQQDPIYGKWHHWEESEEVYMTETEAKVAAERFIDNYEPADDDRYSEQMSFQEMMASFQRLK